MAQQQCERCRGTGLASAARDSGTEGAQWMHVQCGVYRCSTCNGTGKIGFTDEEEEAIAEAARKALERMSSNS